LPVSIEECKSKLYEILKTEGVTDRKAVAALVDTFLQTEEHVSAADLSLQLNEDGIKIDTQSVGLALTLLAEYGFAIELKFEGETAKRYEHLHPNQHHDHFICIKCKKVLELRDRKLETVQESLIFQKGCKPLFHKLEVYGICDECGFVEKRPIPITYAKEDTTVTLSKIEAKQTMKKRLTELGFIENEKIQIIKNSHFGPLILEVRGSRLAIGRGQAQYIYVYEK